MRIYVAGKFEEKARVRAVQDALRSAGHTITCDWTDEDVGRRKGEELAAYRRRCALRDVEGVIHADAILVLNHKELYGGMVEFGVAAGLGKKLYVVGAAERDSVFWALPSVKHFATEGEALKEIGPQLLATYKVEAQTSFAWATR